MARIIRSITSDPRYPALVQRYRYDWVRFFVELIGDEPTYQQVEIIRSAQRTGSLTSVSSGHGTGKSHITAGMVLAFMILFPHARVVLVANNARQVKIGVWKYLRTHWTEICKRKPWIAQYFVLTDTVFYERSGKGVWELGAKSCRLGQEESLAGEHSENYMVVVDEASGVSDKAFGVLGGALTQGNNRMLLLSQPTRPAGFFYDTHHTLAETPDKPSTRDIPRWTAIKLNSEESPLVTTRFIMQKRLEYGGAESPEYLIKVRGEFPDQIAGFLLSRTAADNAVKNRPQLDEDWGWVALCDVGNGRDKSILNIMRISGRGANRKAVSHKLMEMDGNIDPVRFADIIFAECTQELYPNITIVIDSDGIGHDTATCCLRYGMRVQRINWGRPLHSTIDRRRFINQRAYANVFARNAVLQGRLQLDPDKKTAEQASKIPCGIDEQGRWVIMPKQKMREKLNIASPDRWDTYCFSQLANYVPAQMHVTEDMEAERSSVESWITEAIPEDV